MICSSPGGVDPRGSTAAPLGSSQRVPSSVTHNATGRASVTSMFTVPCTGEMYTSASATYGFANNWRRTAPVSNQNMFQPSIPLSCHSSSSVRYVSPENRASSRYRNQRSSVCTQVAMPITAASSSPTKMNQRARSSRHSAQLLTSGRCGRQIPTVALGRTASSRRTWRVMRSLRRWLTRRRAAGLSAAPFVLARGLRAGGSGDEDGVLATALALELLPLRSCP